MTKKTVVVTGATRGIGRAIAEKFAENDFNVIGLYEKSTEIAQTIEKSFLNIKMYQCDISNFKKVSQVAEKIILEHKKIDVLVNNAGISKYQMFCDYKEEDYSEIFDINVKGTFNVTNAFLNNMTQQKKGCIINISSMWGEVGASMEVLYSSSKGAIIAFTKALAKEMGLSGIRVNCVSAGVIKTDMLQDFTKEDLENLKEETPLNAIGKPLDIANAVYFLASDEASFITGQVISVNGGFVV